MKDGTTMAPLTVVPEPEPTVKCGVLQVPVGLNQAARLNGCFVVPETRHHGGGKWRPVNEWESPVWGWLVVNYADYGLQIFNADGMCNPYILAQSDLSTDWVLSADLQESFTPRLDLVAPAAPSSTPGNSAPEGTPGKTTSSTASPLSSTVRPPSKPSSPL